MAEAVRQALTANLFPPGGPEKLVIHVKTYQDISHSASAPEEMKGTPRYFCLTQKKSTMRLLKVKKNHNGNFQMSKTWSLNDIKEIAVANSHSFSITLNKTYLLFVEKVKEKMIFLAFLIDCCKRSANHMPKLVNIDQNRTLMYLADPSAPTLGSSSFYNKSTSSSSLPQRSSVTLVSTNSAHSPLEPVIKTSTTSVYSSKDEPSSAPLKPIHHEFNPPSQKISSVSSENHLYQRSPLSEGSIKYSVEEDDASPPQTPLSISRNGKPRVTSHTWSAYKSHPKRASSSSIFTNIQEEQQPRSSLDGAWKRSYSSNNSTIKVQPIRTSTDSWQPHDINYQQQSFDNTCRRSMDNENSPFSQRRSNTNYYNMQPHSPQPNNWNKQSPLLSERPSSTDIPIMTDTNRSMSPTSNISAFRPLSPSMLSPTKNNNEIYDEPEACPENRSSLPPIHPPTNLPRREGSPMYVKDQPSRSEVDTYDMMSPYHSDARKSMDSGWQSPSAKRGSYDMNSLKIRNSYEPHSPTPLRKSMDSRRNSIKQELPDLQTSFSKPRNSITSNRGSENFEKVDSTLVTKNADGWQAQQEMNSSQPRDKILPALQMVTEPISMNDLQGQTFSDSDGAHSRNSTLSNNTTDAFKKIDPANQPNSMDKWKPLPSAVPYEENVDTNRISKRNVLPFIPKPQNSPDTKPEKEEKVLIPSQPPVAPPRKNTIIANNISGKNSPPPIPKPRKDLPKEEDKILIPSQSPPIPARRDIPPRKINQAAEKEEPNVYNKIDTVKRPVRRTTQETPSSQKMEDPPEDSLLDNNNNKQDGIEDTDYCLKNILKHIDKSMAELESMESWLALYGTKGGSAVESI